MRRCMLENERYLNVEQLTTEMRRRFDSGETHGQVAYRMFKEGNTGRSLTTLKYHAREVQWAIWREGEGGGPSQMGLELLDRVRGCGWVEVPPEMVREMRKTLREAEVPFEEVTRIIFRRSDVPWGT